MKILITGGAGFLGMHLAKTFQSDGHRVTLLDIADFDPSEYKGKFSFTTADIRNRYAIEKAIADSDYVVHAAAALPLWKKEDILTTNILGTKNILSLAKKHHVKRVVYISSTAVYGVPKKHPIDENDRLVGVGPYGISKIEAEKACWRAIKRGLNVTILRPKTFVGTGRLGVFEILFDWIHDGKKIPVVGSGNKRYQLLDVDDLVSAIVHIILSRSERMNDVFNIGAAEFDTVRNDLGKLFTAAKSGSRIQPTPAFLTKWSLRILELMNLSPLYRWVYDTADKDSYVSIEKLTKTIRWKPRYSNADALIKAYRWYQKHYDEIKMGGSGLTHRVGWKQGALAVVKRLM